MRITEAVAKTSLSPEATSEHVKEAVRLFRVSTLAAAASGLMTLESNMSEELRKTVQIIEGRVVRMVPVGGAAPAARVKEQLLRAGFADAAIHAAIKVMERRGDVALVNERKTLRRIK